MDPITAILSGQWATVTGWSLWIGTVVVIVSALLTDRLWSGKRGRALQATVDKQQVTIADLTSQNGQLIANNELTKHWFEVTLPSDAKRTRATVDDSEGGRP